MAEDRINYLNGAMKEIKMAQTVEEHKIMLVIYTVSYKLSISQTLFQRRIFRLQISLEEQPVCNILLP